MALYAELDCCNAPKHEHELDMDIIEANGRLREHFYFISNFNKHVGRRAET